MSQLEYLIALVSMIVALAIADLLGSIRELVRPRRAVEWHWLPIAWTTIVLMLLVQFWWVSFAALQGPVFGQALAFLPYLMTVLVLYLACAFALPDPDCRPECAPEKQPNRRTSMEQTPARPAGALDMRAFYFSQTHRRWFFGALLVLTVLGVLLSILSSLILGRASASTMGLTALSSGAVVGLLATLIATNRRGVHAFITALLLIATTCTMVVGLPSIG